MTMGVYKFYNEFGRQGDLEGVFIADSADVADAVGKTAYFGEVLGKHSDVSCKLEASMMKLVTETPEVVDVIYKYDLTSGFDPLAYIRRDDE